METIRGVRVIHEGGNANKTWIEHLRYSLDVFDAGDNLAEVLGRLADLDPARAAFAVACAMYPAKRIFLRDGARVLGRSDEPPERLTAYRPIPVFKENP
jgi:multidrug efflux pump subunit AcrA (membrane-fusion protein)